MSTMKASRKFPKGSAAIGPVKFIALRIHGDAVDPAELTQLLGKPTRSYAKGERIGDSEHPFVTDTGMWSLSTRTEDFGTLLAVHLAFIIGRLAAHAEALSALVARTNATVELTIYPARHAAREQTRPLPTNMRPAFERMGIREMQFGA